MSISASRSGMSGMQAYQRALDVSGHNVANGLNSGFHPQQATFKESMVQGADVSITASSPIAGLQSPLGVTGETDLATEMVNQLIYQIGFEASTQVVKVSDQLLGTLIDLTA